MSIKLIPGDKKKKNKKRDRAARAFEPQASFEKRVPRLIVIIAACFIGLIGRIFYIQVIDRYDILTKGAFTQWTRSTVIAAERGEIVDTNGVQLAVNAPVYKVVVWPQEIKSSERERVALELSNQLGVSYETLVSKLGSTTVKEYVVKRHIDKATADTITALHLGSGVGVTTDTMRYYPYGTLLSQVLGFTNVDNAGQSGLELSLDKYLTGQNGRLLAETDQRGNTLVDGSSQFIEPVDGSKVRLTIDKYFQSYLENALEEARLVNNAATAQGIILDVNTGAIMAISTKPDYDPNDPPRSDLAALAALSKNRIVTDAYEPGSTFKILTLASAIDSGCVSLSSGFYCNGGYIVNGERIKCWRHAGHGSQNLTEATENSCNVCFMQLALSMGVEKFYDYLYAFGLGQATGSGLVGESAGIVTHEKYVTENDLARIGFGQSVAVTPIQLAAAVAAAVNGGELHTPYIVEEIVADDGTVVFKADTTPVRRVISAETSKTVCGILQSVVDNGTGRNAKIEGYAVGGKTGTAQKYDKYGHVASGSYICSFIGFAPADEPKYLCLILVDEPHVSSIFGSTVAAPFVRRVLSEILPYAHVPKSGVNAQTVCLPDVTGMAMQEAVELLAGYGIEGIYECDAVVTLQIPAAGQYVPAGSSVLLYTGREGLNLETDAPYMVTMPNLIGMTPLQAYDALKAVGLNMAADPSDPYGIVIGQSVYAFEPVEYGSTVIVYFGYPTPEPGLESPTPTQGGEPLVTEPPADGSPSPATPPPTGTAPPDPAPSPDPTGGPNG